MAGHSGRVLVIDNDRDIADIVYAVLTDAGFAVSVLADVRPDPIRVAVGQLEPDCVLLDGESVLGYGQSWTDAAWLSSRDRAVPVIMFSADVLATREAREASSPRSQAAHFAAVFDKPFDLDLLVDAVARAAGHAVPFDPSPGAEARRTATLGAKLAAAGAREIHLSTPRQWANFRTEDGTLVQLYWWEHDSVYYVVRHAESGGRLDQVGRFYNLDTAIALAMTVRRQDEGSAPAALRRAGS
jgi:CheY-like chemotaxis protein